MLKLLEAFLTQGVLEEMNLWTPEAGTPQGAVISPLLSNIYLDALDHEMAGKGIEMVRYADDFVVLCGTQGEAQQALEEVRRWTAQAGLTLHPVKTRIVDATQPGGFDFLGYHFEQGRKWPRRKSERKFRDTIRAKTRRTHGQSLQATIVDLNRTLMGWFGYFQHSYKTTFATLDRWVRMRLRSILRHRQGWQGTGTRSGSSALAQCLLCGARVVLLGYGPCYRLSVLSRGKTTNWRAGCGRSACPVRREGDSNSIGSPYPYRLKSAHRPPLHVIP